jgi:hypothetical protein
MPNAIAAIVAAILAGIGLIHVFWGLGGNISGAAVVPEVAGRRAFSPSRFATLAVASCLFAASYIVAAAGHLIANPFGRLPRYLAFGLSALFLVRAIGDFRLVGFFKRFRESRFARLDTAVYSPLCLCLALGTVYVAYFGA